MKLRLGKIQAIFALFLVFSVFVGLSCIAAADIDGNASSIDDGDITLNDDSSVNATVLEPAKKIDDNSGPILDDDNDFTMSARYNAGTGYHWEVSPETHGVDLISTNHVQDRPGVCGGSGTVYFSFHVNSDDYYVKLVLISPTGDIVDELDSGMLN